MNIIKSIRKNISEINIRKIPIVVYDGKSLGYYMIVFDLSYFPKMILNTKEFYNSTEGIMVTLNFNIISLFMIILFITHFVFKNKALMFVKMFCLLMFSALIFHLTTYVYFILKG